VASLTSLALSLAFRASDRVDFLRRREGDLLLVKRARTRTGGVEGITPIMLLGFVRVRLGAGVGVVTMGDEEEAGEGLYNPPRVVCGVVATTVVEGAEAARL
jgi:hypothetical protein